MLSTEKSYVNCNNIPVFRCGNVSFLFYEKEYKNDFDIYVFLYHNSERKIFFSTLSSLNEGLNSHNITTEYKTIFNVGGSNILTKVYTKYKNFKTDKTKEKYNKKLSIFFEEYFDSLEFETYGQTDLEESDIVNEKTCDLMKTRMKISDYLLSKDF